MPQVNALKENYRCIVPDLWSHGESAPLDKDAYSIEEMAEDHKRLLDYLNIEKCAVVGLSVGGMWGAALAIKYPELVQALVMMDTYVGPEPAATKARYNALLDTVTKAGYFSKALIDVVAPMFFSPSTVQNDAEIFKAFKKHLVEIAPENIPGIVAFGLWDI